MNESLIGIGLYTAADAQRLTGIPVARIRRWIRGYSYETSSGVRIGEPLWQSSIDNISNTLEIDFRDLTELLFVDAFRRAGLSLQQIRLGLNETRSIIGDNRPFSTAKFKTDGNTIFIESAREAEEPALIDLLKKQHVFHRFVAPTFKTLDFEDNIPIRWWPIGKNQPVLIDPNRSFGRPIVQSGVATDILADSYKLTNSYKRTALDYGVTDKEVRSAINFQNKSNLPKFAKAA